MVKTAQCDIDTSSTSAKRGETSFEAQFCMKKMVYNTKKSPLIIMYHGMHRKRKKKIVFTFTSAVQKLKNTTTELHTSVT